MPTPKISRAPRVTVVFDSNVLFTDHVDKLICREAEEYCSGESTKLGLDIEWRLPQVVISERKNQMINKAATLSESVRKLERLVGHNWGVTPETLELHITANIQRQLEELNMKPIQLDFEKVDWESLVDAASRRLAPFSKEKEKGFKDAIILETFMQCAASSPRSPSAARIFLITDDTLLKQAANERVKGLKNVSVLASIDDLRTEINAVAAHLPKEFIDRYVQKAKDLFFVEANKSGLLYDWGILNKIRDQFADVLSTPPELGYRVNTKINNVSVPTFIRKEGQRLIFLTKIRREMIATPPFGESADAAIGTKLGLLSLGQAYDLERSPIEGQHIFEVVWSLTLNKAGRLISPHLIDFSHASSSWNAA